MSIDNSRSIKLLLIIKPRQSFCDPWNIKTDLTPTQRKKDRKIHLFLTILGRDDYSGNCLPRFSVRFSCNEHRVQFEHSEVESLSCVGIDNCRFQLRVIVILRAETPPNDSLRCGYAIIKSISLAPVTVSCTKARDV